MIEQLQHVDTSRKARVNFYLSYLAKSSKREELIGYHMARNIYQLNIILAWLIRETNIENIILHGVREH